MIIDRRRIVGRSSVLLVLVLATAGWIAEACSEEPAPLRPTFGPSPRLATTVAELAIERARPNFAVRRAAALKAADALLAAPPALPDGYGSWTFYYACPDDGTTLRPITPDEHACPKCDRHFSDERTVAAYRGRMHRKLETAALALGWAYAYSHDTRYAAAVRRILVHLADQYETYPWRLDRWGRRGWFAPLGGRRYVQSLDEAVGVIDLAKAYDLTRDAAVWTADDRTHVERDFFRATADSLQTFNQDINNHQTWYNAGLMAIASVLGDAKLVDRVLTMQGGFYDQLQRSLGDDGLWYEGSMAYQNYALQAMVAIVEAGRRLDLPLHEAPRFKTLLASSLRVAYPDGTYPAINDSDPNSFRSFAWSYEWAWRTYGDRRFAQAAAWGNSKELAELLGPEAKPESPFETKSINLADVGWVVLRAGSGPEQACVFFDYGQHGEGHGHYDKLNITLFAQEREWLFDVGRIGYSHKEYKTWVKHTVAHNTVVVDERDQAATTGKLLWFHCDEEGAACAAECTTAYSGLTLRRNLRLTSRLLVDVFDVQAAEPHQLDWLMHAKCDAIESVGDGPAEPSAALGRGEGYAHLIEAQRWPAQTSSSWNLRAGDRRLRVWCIGDAADEPATAVGIGQRVDEKAPTLLRRRSSSTRARFVTVYDLAGDGPTVTGAVLGGTDDAPEVIVHTAERKQTFRFTAVGFDGS
jgi:hypothetical protein